MKTTLLSAPLHALMLWYYGWDVQKLGVGTLLVFVWDLVFDFWKEILGSIAALYLAVGCVRFLYFAIDNIHNFTYHAWLDWWNHWLL